MYDLAPIYTGTQNLFAQDWEAFMGMGIGFFLVVVIPIVGILTHHQRKMAELMRGQQGQPADLRTQQQLEVMQSQINELKGLIQDHIIRNDSPSISMHQTPPTPPATIEQRLNQ